MEVRMSPISNPRALPRYDKIPARSYKQLPDRPNLEHLKGQAKALLRDFLAGKPDALRRVRRFLPNATQPLQAATETNQRRPLRLKDGQIVVAREFAKGGWK